MNTTEIDGLEVAYRDEGSGPPVVLLHGWPTSSFLWRNVIPPIAERNRVIAPDLPGFGASDKPLDRTYDFEFFERVLDGLLENLDIKETGLAVHDLGGPVGVHWAIGRPERVTKLALLNTLLYPDFHESVGQFLAALSAPESRDFLTGPDGLEAAMKLGLAEGNELSDEALAGVRAPFADEDSRLALAAAGIQLSPEGFEEIGSGIASLRMPVRIVYGEQDRILPDVAETMNHVARDVPGTEITALADCGHFLQEEQPEKIAELLSEFFAT